MNYVTDVSHGFRHRAEGAADFLNFSNVDVVCLQHEFGIFIPRGIPDMPFVDPNFYKDQFSVEGKNVLLTFGLLSPNKGIKHALRAMPAILKEFPETVYILLGATHPNLVREQGEGYRLSLERLAQDLGIKKNVTFYNRFVELEELTEFIGAAEVDELLPNVLAEFHGRYQKLEQFLLKRFEAEKNCLFTDSPISRNRQLLIGSYFTQEYALESAALFSASIVWHPDQKGMPAGSKRFIVSLRATGEGHISSHCFRSGVIDSQGDILLDEPSRFVTAPDVVANAEYERAIFQRKLVELGVADGFRLPNQAIVRKLEAYATVRRVTVAGPSAMKKFDSASLVVVASACSPCSILHNLATPAKPRTCWGCRAT